MFGLIIAAALAFMAIAVYIIITNIVAETTSSAIISLDRDTCFSVFEGIFYNWIQTYGEGDLNYEGGIHPRISIHLDADQDGEQTRVEVRVRSKRSGFRAELAKLLCQPMTTVAMLKLGYYSDDPLQTPPGRARRMARRLLSQEDYRHYSEYRDDIYQQLDIELESAQFSAVHLDAYDIHQHLRSDVLAARQSRRPRRLPEEIDERDNSAIESALLRAINTTLGPSGRLAFPLSAPRLVELESDQAVAVSSAREIAEFVELHQASAIGVSGPRGSGKTTLLRAVAAQMDGGPSVNLSVPVSYEREEFTRRLVLEILAALRTQWEPEVVIWLPPSRRMVQVAFLGACFIALGVVGLFRRYGFDGGSVLALTPTNLGVIVAAVVVGSIAVLGVALAWRRENRGEPDGLPPSIRRRINSMYDHLVADVEQTLSAKAAAKLSLFELGGERSRKSRRRTFTQPDLVVEIRQLLEDALKSTASEQMLICIDELDKVASPEDAVRTVNSLKDLFHVRGVHFIVTVSDEALSSFAQRSVLPRDAFDSAFDLVLRVSAFTSTESINLILSRAAGFPSSLALFCHAWSGGLPREMLRTARRCIELQRLEADSLPLSQLVNRLVVGDAITLIDSSLLNEVAINDGRQVALESLRHAMLAVQSEPSCALRVGSELPDPRGVEDKVVGAVVRRCQIALLLVALASSVSSAGSSWWLVPGTELTHQADALAAAVRSLGLIGELRDAPFDAAIGSLSHTLGVWVI